LVVILVASSDSFGATDCQKGGPPEFFTASNMFQRCNPETMKSVYFHRKIAAHAEPFMIISSLRPLTFSAVRSFRSSQSQQGYPVGKKLNLLTINILA
jgi:hypothetical protein